MKSRSMEALLAAALVCAAGEASAQDRAAFGAAMDAFARRAMQRVEAGSVWPWPWWTGTGWSMPQASAWRTWRRAQP